MMGICSVLDGVAKLKGRGKKGICRGISGAKRHEDAEGVLT